MLKNPFSSLSRNEWLLWVISVITVTLSNILSGQLSPVTLSGTLIGVTALVFLARGDVWGQILTVVFSILYSITSLEFCYYGEMVTYLGMTMPIALMSVVTWLRHPYEKDKNEVKIHKMTKRQIVVMLFMTATVTAIFYFILRHFNTANLFFSTVSVTTSFLASYLMLMRSSYYAVAYAANDVVLIILWILATLESIAYLPMIICFTMFFINDMYGFLCWKAREKRQKNTSAP